MTEEKNNPPPTILEEIRQSKPFRTRSQEAYLGLLRTADDARRRVASELEATGITLQQYNVLRILRGAGAQGLATLEIGQRMIERTPGVTRLIDRMVKRGWVVRQRCTEDRRRVWCRITEVGLEILAGLDERVNAVDDSLFGALDEPELVQFVDFLDRIRAYLRD
jgi:DNA-binding MarR family transcriptional regulator